MNGWCHTKGCNAPSDVRPVRLIFPPLPGTCPAKGVIGREYCAACAARLTVADFVTEEGWTQLTAGFARFGTITPDRSRLRLLLEPLIHAERN